MINSLLVANRGEIAGRIFRTARAMGVRSVAVATEADRSWPFWREADEAVFIGDGPVGESYLSIPKIIEAAKQASVDAIHPGYGFLSENAEFAEACAKAGLIFIGPPVAAILAMGSKSDAKVLMEKAGVPVVPGYHGERQDTEFLRKKAYEVGYPILIKAVAGGGGRGMRRVDKAKDFDEALAAARREAKSGFGDDRVLLERYVTDPRHIEVQIFADIQGHVVHFGERDCSVQRRHQKVIEEAPAPGLRDDVRDAIGAMAVKAAKAVDYVGAGTVEFIADGSRGLRADDFFFMEMNTRLQVEHPVTEVVTGVDLVELQIKIAAGEPLPVTQDQITITGHAFEARLYAEDPSHDFRPGTGPVILAEFPADSARVDSGIETGSMVSPFYDSMLAKIIVKGPDRDSALDDFRDALGKTRIAGPNVNLAFLRAIADHPEFKKGGVSTGFVGAYEKELVAGGVPVSTLEGALAKHIKDQGAAFAAQSPGPWRDSDGFEVGDLDRHQGLTLTIDGTECHADLTWAAGDLRVELPAGVADPRAESGKCPVILVVAQRDLLVLYRGHQARVQFEDPLVRTLEGAKADGQIMSPMHGRVSAVHVALHDTVKRGAPLFIIEAMKMEHTIVAPIDGKISEIRVREGQQVGEADFALTVEPDS